MDNMERIITISTNRSHYNIKGAADESMTVAELIEELRYLPGDCKVVFKNDGGYTYGYISDRDIDSEYIEPEEEVDDYMLDRDDMEHEIYNAVRKTNIDHINLIGATSDDGERIYLSVGYNDSRVFGVWTDEEEFIPIEDLSDNDVEEIWNTI